MKERGIIMTAWSVQAIRAGRKTQTRRLIVPQPVFATNGAWHWGYPDRRRIQCGPRGVSGGSKFPFDAEAIGDYCPWGVAGDLLWVRETYTVVPLDMMARDHEVRYKADGATKVLRGGSASGPEVHIDFASEAEEYPCEKYGVWRSPRHMYRWASRILLEITDVRVELLCCISREDAQSEGFDSVEDFARLWDTLHRKDGLIWQTNPWVWVVTFRPISH